MPAYGWGIGDWSSGVCSYGAEGGGGAAGTHYRRYDGDAAISAEEHMQGWRFDGGGIKYFHPGSATEKLVAKLERFRAAYAAEKAEEEAATGACMRCGQLAVGEAGADDRGDGDPASG